VSATADNNDEHKQKIVAGVTGMKGQGSRADALDQTIVVINNASFSFS